MFLTLRRPARPVAGGDLCPVTGRARLSYRRAEESFELATRPLANPGATPEELDVADGWTLHQLRHSLLTHEAEDGTSTLLAALLIFLHRRRPSTGPRGGRLRRVGRTMLDGLAPLCDLRVLAASFGLAYVTRATDLAAAWTVTASLGLPASYAAAVLPLLLVEVSNALPTAPAQIGSFEAGAASAVRLLGGSITGSVAFAVLFHAQQVLPQIAAGIAPLWAASTARRREATGQEQTQ